MFSEEECLNDYFHLDTSKLFVHVSWKTSSASNGSYRYVQISSLAVTPFLEESGLEVESLTEKLGIIFKHILFYKNPNILGLISKCF